MKSAGKENSHTARKASIIEGGQEILHHAKSNSLDTTLVDDRCIFGARVTDRQTPTIRSIPQRPSDPSKWGSNPKALSALLSDCWCL